MTDDLDAAMVAANLRVNAAREELALAEHEMRSVIIASQLPGSALLSPEDHK